MLANSCLDNDIRMYISIYHPNFANSTQLYVVTSLIMLIIQLYLKKWSNVTVLIKWEPFQAFVHFKSIITQKSFAIRPI